MVELGVPTMARGRSAGWGHGPGLLVTETVTNGQTDVFLFLPAFRAATLRGPQFAQEEGRTGSEPTPRPGLGSGVWGLGTPPRPVPSRAVVRGQGEQTLLAPGGGGAFAPRVGCVFTFWGERLSAGGRGIGGGELHEFPVSCNKAPQTR